MILHGMIHLCLSNFDMDTNNFTYSFLGGSVYGYADGDGYCSDGPNGGNFGDGNGYGLGDGDGRLYWQTQVDKRELINYGHA